MTPSPGLTLHIIHQLPNHYRPSPSQWRLFKANIPSNALDSEHGPNRPSEPEREMLGGPRSAKQLPHLPSRVANTRDPVPHRYSWFGVQIRYLMN